MNKSVIAHNFRIEITAGAVVTLQNPHGRERTALRGPVRLTGIKCEPDDPEGDWWVIFPSHRGFGLDSEALIDAWLQKKLTAWDIRDDGTEDLTFKETPR
ncbi:MAG: hypothetical protein AAB582_03730 [Patescibacteria group bacterium]